MVLGLNQTKRVDKGSDFTTDQWNDGYKTT